MIRFYLYCLFLLSSLTISFGQSVSKKDSLRGIINNENNIDEKLKAYNELLYDQLFENPDEVTQILNELKQLSTEKSCDKCLSSALYWEGQYNFQLGKYNDAIKVLIRCKDVAEKIGDDYTRDKAITFLSSTYFVINDYKNAKQYASILINNNKEKDSITNAIIDGYFMLGMINDDQSYYSLAVQNYKKADSLNDLQNSEYAYDYKGRIYVNLANIFISLNNYNKAEFYLTETNSIYKNNNDDAGIFLAQENLGLLKVKQKKYKEAIDLLIPTEDYYKKINYQNNLANVQHYLGLAYLNLENYNLSLEKLSSSLEIHKSTGDSLKTAHNYKSIGDCYFRLKNNAKTYQNYTNALIIYESLLSLEGQINTLSALSIFNEKINNTSKALLFERKKDSLIILNQKRINQRITYETEAKYQKIKKEQEIAVLKTQNKLIEQQKKTQLYLLLSGVFILLISGAFLYYQYKTKKKINTKLRELDKVKSNFFTNISHEFRTPLTLISGPIQKKLKDPKLSIEERTSLEMISRNANRLLSLVDQLLDISKLETGDLHLSISKNQLLNFIGILTESFKFSAKQKNINFLSYINKTSADTWYDSDVIEKIIVNLLSNAIKYTPENGSIVCNAFVDKNQFHFEIKNSGKGLTNDELHKIFDKFYQLNTHHEGAGIGLSLVKELVSLHKGTIDVKSTLNEWTLFKIVLPIDENSYNEPEISKTATNKSPILPLVKNEVFEIPTEVPIENEIKNEQPILLIVDDNKDIRDYIDTIFNKSYNIIKAKNGQEGIEVAIKLMPDIIISDIMMPIKNGIELCNHLKEDERTSHIPIILLTAKKGEKNELTGIKTGADDYITKPFNEDLLIVKIENIIKSRKKLQERYSQEIILMPKEITVNSVDEKFLTKIQKVLDTNLVESSFSIEEFSKAIGMSRMQLHRKLKALTGLTTSEFIRSQRLKLAISLLENSDYNVSEIGYSVGFNNHAYFSKCFKETYNCTPTEYLERRK